MRPPLPDCEDCQAHGYCICWSDADQKEFEEEMSKPPVVPSAEDLKAFMLGEKGDTGDGDLTQEAFEAIQSLKVPEARELKVSFTADGFVEVGNDLGQRYMKLTPDETTKFISLLMEARAAAVRAQKAKG